MKRFTAQILAGLLLLAMGSGIGFTSSHYLVSSVKDGLAVKGRVLVEAFHARLGGACEIESAKEHARTAWVEEQPYRMLSGTSDARGVIATIQRFLSPTKAWASLGFPCTKFAERYITNLIVNAGETALRDCFNGNSGSACTNTVAVFRFHGLGTGSTAAAEGNTGCETELTTQYNPNNTRATGSQTTNGANVYRTVGTNTVDETAAVTEWCLLNQAATGDGTLWSRVVFSTINLAANDSLQTTYDLTIE